MSTRRLAVLALAAVVLGTLGGADGCPLAVNPSTTTPQGSTSSSLDVGGQSGALWQVQFDTEVLVTLRLASGQAAAKKVPLRSGLVDLLGATISVPDLCWRTDLVCPQGVLSEQTAIQQPATGGLLVGFNRRGPLAAMKDNGLSGTLSGADLSVPLGVGQAAAGLCALGSSSAILASAYASSGTRADTMQGRVTVAYDGTCAGLGGAALPADSRLELSLGFAGKRQ